jgi:hypothetical protein
MARWRHVLIASVLGATVGTHAWAQTGTATNVFVGTAITGPSEIFPGVFVLADVGPSTSPDPSCLFSYTYIATGLALGDLPGTFTYTEQGNICLQDGGVVSVIDSAVIELDPYAPGANILIPVTATYGFATSTVQALSPEELQLIAFLPGVSRQGGTVELATFTFATEEGTFAGFATPDFAELVFELTFTH